MFVPPPGPAMAPILTGAIAPSPDLAGAPAFGEMLAQLVAGLIMPAPEPAPVPATWVDGTHVGTDEALVDGEPAEAALPEMPVAAGRSATEAAEPILLAVAETGIHPEEAGRNSRLGRTDAPSPVSREDLPGRAAAAEPVAVEGDANDALDPEPSGDRPDAAADLELRGWRQPTVHDAAVSAAEARAVLLGVVPSARAGVARGVEPPPPGAPGPSLGEARAEAHAAPWGVAERGRVAAPRYDAPGPAPQAAAIPAAPAVEATHATAVAHLLRELLERPAGSTEIGHARQDLQATIASGNLPRIPRGVPQVLAGVELQPGASAAPAALVASPDEAMPFGPGPDAQLAPSAPLRATRESGLADPRSMQLPAPARNPVAPGIGAVRLPPGASDEPAPAEHPSAPTEFGAVPTASGVVAQSPMAVAAMPPMPLSSNLGHGTLPATATPHPAEPPAPPPQPESQVTLVLDSASSGANRIRVALRGDVVHATIVADVAAAVALTQRLPELQRSLRDRGFSEAQLSVRVLGAETVAAPAAIRPESAATSGQADARPESEPRQGQRRADPDGRQRQPHRHPEPEESA